MGFLDFFRTRPERESALGGSGASADLAQQVNPHGAQVDSSDAGIHGLGDLGTMISQLHR